MESASSELQSLSEPEFGSSTMNSGSSSSSMQTEPITEFSILIEKLSPILDGMKEGIQVPDQPVIQKAIGSFETDYKRARKVIDSQSIQSSPAKHIECLIQNLGRSLGLVLFAARKVPLAEKQKIESLCTEMMNVRFDLSSEEDEMEEKTEDTVEENTVVFSIDEAVLQIKYGIEEEFKNGLRGLNTLIMNGSISCDRINSADFIKVLSNRLSSSKRNERVTIVQILRHLVKQNGQNKEKMKDLEFLSSLVKSLARDVEEQREAVGLLLSLLEDAEVRRRIAGIQWSIVMLVSISNGDDQEASYCAKEMLNAMSSNAQQALHMAEAGYFKPLVKFLKQGSDMSKVVLATALSRMELTEQNKASIGESGGIEPLVEMFNTGTLEAKLSALKVLQSLSYSKQNIKRLIDSGIVSALLQLLFSVTSVLMTLCEPASAILAKVAQYDSILVKQDVAFQMLSVLTISSPVTQNHLFQALNSIASHPSAAKVRKKMKENGAIQLLSAFFQDMDSKIRTGALKLVSALSKDITGELTEQMGYTNISIVASIVFPSNSDFEKAAALGILSNLPVSDRRITDLLKGANLMRAMVSVMGSISADSTPTTLCLAESIARILIRFTIPSDKRLQHYSVENGIVPVLVKLLSISSETAKSNAALCLAQLSQSSLHLAKSRKMKWFCVAPASDAFCEVHDGYCSVKSTFCLVKAGAITPLIQILEGKERGADEAALSCISTLLQDEIWESGCDYMVKKSIVHPVIRVLDSGDLKAQEKALYILERIFRVEAHRAKYGESAQGLLIDLAQKGDHVLPPTVAKILAQLELLQDQSNYF